MLLKRRLFCLLLVLSWTLAPMVRAQSASLFVPDGRGAMPLIAPARGALFARHSGNTGDTANAVTRAARISLFAPLPDRAQSPSRAMRRTPAPTSAPANAVLRAPPPYVGAAARIRHLIAQAEAGRAGYDAVQHGAKIRPRKPPTAMTLHEIYDWIARTPRQPHAIGRYQFIPATLKRLVKQAGLPLNTRFSAKVQDQLADILLAEAGYHKARRGELSRTAFMNNLAKIWAGLPNSSGKSHYHGYAGNKATMSWARFDREMARIMKGA